MNTDVVTNAYLNVGVANSGPPEASQELDQDDFLSLLMTQMQNQDPLDPMESQQMLEQIASLNQVELLQELNTNMESVILGVASLNNASAVQLVDQNVMVLGDEFTASSTSVDLGYVLPSSADQVTVTVTDSDGVYVTEFNETDMEAGLHELSWSGATPGETYTLSITATADDTEISAATAICGVVEGLDFSEGFVQLVIGDMTVGLAEVLKVMPNSPDDEAALASELLAASMDLVTEMLDVFGDQLP